MSYFPEGTSFNTIKALPGHGQALPGLTTRFEEIMLWKKKIIIKINKQEETLSTAINKMFKWRNNTIAN